MKRLLAAVEKIDVVTVKVSPEARRLSEAMMD